MENNKMTNKKALVWVLENVNDIPDDVRERVEAMIATLEKRARAERKPTKKQLDNAPLVDMIVEYVENAANGATVADITANCFNPGEVTPQQVTGLVNVAVKAGRLTAKKVKGKNVYTKVEG